MFFKAYNNINYFIKRHVSTLLPFLTAYKLYNVVLAFIEMQMRRTACNSKPFIYRIDPCTLCNLRCVSCGYHKLTTTEKRIMDLRDFKIIIDKIHHVALRASLYDAGEPLLNKNIYSMIKYASDKHISTLISTNFNLFRKEHLDMLFNSRLTVLEPCLDGFTQEQYEKYRTGGNVEIVKDGIRMVMERKKQIITKWPIVNVQVINFDHIRDEIPLIHNFLKRECKVDQITFRQESLGFNRPETTIFKKSHPYSSTCFWLYLGMMIRPDGNVYPCCGRGFGRFSYGNLLKQDLLEIWNNKYYQFSRAIFQKGSDLEYTEEMKDIPCITCKEFQKTRRIRKK